MSDTFDLLNNIRYRNCIFNIRF